MATELDLEEVKVYETFDSMDLKEDLLRGIYAFGFQKPSVIQTKGIKVIAEGRDLLAQANPGGSYPAAFGKLCGMVETIDLCAKLS